MDKYPGIVIHCSDTYPDMDIGVDEIRRWHVDENGWSDIGYHFVIRRNGNTERGRPLSRDGAHTKGLNNWIGICLVGGKAHQGKQPCNFTRLQYEALEDLVTLLQEGHGIPDENVIGHNEVSQKACPSFDVRAWMEK